ncbi:MAG: nitrogen fixation protein [Frankia sp.]
MTGGPALCPSAPAGADGAVVFGVVGGTVDEPRTGYLPAAVLPTPDLLAATAPVTPTEVLRFASPCAGARCLQYDKGTCSIGRRLVDVAAPVVARLPRCAIRPDCRWWREQGVGACLRCPGVVTTRYAPPPDATAVAGPAGAAAGERASRLVPAGDGGGRA